MRLRGLLAGLGLLVAGTTYSAVTPRVVLLSEVVNDAVTQTITEKAGGKFQIVVNPAGGALDSQAALLAVDKVAPRSAEVLVLGLGGEDLRKGVALDVFLGNLRAIADKAREREMVIIWCGITPDPADAGKAEVAAWQEVAGKLMQERGAITADYPGFLKSVAARAPDKQLPPAKKLDGWKGEFFAEAIGQWWSVLATTNPDVVRMKLWPDGRPPEFVNPGPERLNDRGRVDRVSEPELTRFKAVEPGKGTAVIFFPGGGYAFLGFLRNARELSEILAPEGVMVFGLSYRTGRGAAVPLHDARRAVQWVRAHAKELGLDPHRIGIAGTSAGANLALNLATQWQPGNPEAADPLDRVSSRPDFVAVFSVWNFGSTESPFNFRADTPPIFLRHARGDKGFALGEKVVQQIQAAGTPVDYLFLDQGGHGAFDFEPGSPGTDWPTAFLAWLRKLGFWEPAQER